MKKKNKHTIGTSCICIHHDSLMRKLLFNEANTVDFDFCSEYFTDGRLPPIPKFFNEIPVQDSNNFISGSLV
ncbi:hypothetical protein DDB_G0272847 [Dictyostelium discoideum AX4]|uniref:Uncharacterized protein n=1 Tax=Dictyostelium discoideum TaxID=44689 RepID=Q558U4_DICDI|nr:hypothetical protein DDB_G0272847 [Dictyostelium discoideum AX4]EAL71061.1 hypothetical protein DDB_G0272847 [Dictyostelium discoideum AX4]|eukprot:XP_644972.1 hypothetical protein DDB_G0272847 [Dictyostelium discoideum AX4]